MTETTELEEKKTRGVRLNNPGNIRHSKEKWFGKAEVQDDPDFITFTTPQAGIRAMARVLITYEKKGYQTVRAITNRWAPPNENDTASYIAHVCQLLCVEPDDLIDVDDFNIMFPLIKAIIAHENKNYAYKDKVVIEGMHMAGVNNTPAKKLIDMTAFRSQAVAAVGAGTSSVALLADPVKKMADGLEPFSGSPIIQQIVTGMVTLAGVAALVGMAGLAIRKHKGLS